MSAFIFHESGNFPIASTSLTTLELILEYQACPGLTLVVINGFVHSDLMKDAGRKDEVAAEVNIC